MTPKPNSRRSPKATVAAVAPGAGSSPLCVVGIGASAGGLGAIRSFLQAMPADSGAAIVVVQHLAPSHVSMAAEIFSKFSAMPVSEIVDGTLIEANHIYTAPSDKDVAVLGGRLCLKPRSDVGSMRLPIDRFFTTLGQDLGTRAIGIILSGTGSDGSVGAKAISEHGGVVLVQEPETAEYDGMPSSAIATGVANYVLPVVQMPQVVATYSRHPYSATRGPMDDTGAATAPTGAIQSVIRTVKARCGYDFAGYKSGTLVRRIERRMGLHGVLRQADYVTFLKANPQEVDALFKDLLIGVTEYFRDGDAWKALETQVIAPLIASKQHDEPIRIWIPGCSTGEEAYTMAMVVLDSLRRARKKCPLQIFATDTNNDALEIGRAGRYPIGIAARVTPTRLRRYFDTGSQQQYFTVKEELRKCVVFGIQNLFADPPFSRVDLISCRNVLIYLEPDIQKRVLGIFHFALRREGYLFLGSAESNGGRDDFFRPLSKKFRLFQREGSTRVEVLPTPPSAPNARGGVDPARPRIVPALSLAASCAQRLILDRFSPASVMVNANHEALYFCGPTDEFLIRPRGAPSHDLMLMVREGLRSRLRTALKEAARTELTVNVEGARMKHGGAFVSVQITIVPSRTADAGRLFLVVFRRDSQPILVPGDQTDDPTLVRHLEEELKTTRDDLQSTIEQFDLTTEDLRVSNEEVVSSNEELRSLNEELESSKEELQSLNEELTTVNQQLETKVHELETANSDQANLLASSDIATICLDESLRIKWFAPATQRLFNFLAGDVGRPISDMLNAIGDVSLLGAARAVLASQTEVDREFQVENGRWYIRRTLPYLDAAHRICGVIVTYTDITDSHLAIEAEKACRVDLVESSDAVDKLRELSAALAMAEDRERRLLAQDLHDDLGQILAIISLKAAMLEKMDLPDPARTGVVECARTVEQANRKLRSMALQLNPPILDQLGLVPAVEWLADEVNRLHKIEIDIEDDGQPKPMDRAVNAILFRALRELLINVAKHARVAKAVVSMVRNADETMSLSVSDAGAGFDPQAVVTSADRGGYGLISLRERLGFLGGTLTVRSVPGDGTLVVVTVPLISRHREIVQSPTAGSP
ncbi:MAG: chemotaxis protein CheB [Rhodoferax sp.]|nr:chemotaxis protein CheB [Rhodoferax sp.]